LNKPTPTYDGRLRAKGVYTTAMHSELAAADEALKKDVVERAGGAP
jgi:hypothetical protein